MYITDSKGSLINLIAGGIALTAVILSYTVNRHFALLAGWVGFMLVLASLTGLCPMFFILCKLKAAPVLEAPEAVRGSRSDARAPGRACCAG